MNISAYNKKDIQTFLSLLNQAEIAGISDVRFLRLRLYNSLSTDRLTARRLRPKVQTSVKNCKDCNTRMRRTGDDTLEVYVCPKCRYSEVI